MNTETVKLSQIEVNSANPRVISDDKFHKLDKPIYASMCEWGLFGNYQAEKEWENIETANQFLP